MTDVGFWEGIVDVASGRGQLRLIVQPAIAILVGIKMGITDAKLGHDPFLKRLTFAGKDRAALAKAAALKVIVPFSIAIVLDGVLQYLTLGRVRLLAALVMGAVLIWIPFSVSRSFTNRVYRHGHPVGST
jgi:hypothetical protein